MFSLTAGAETPRRRRPRDPKPRFKADLSAQLSYVRGCPDAEVPANHLARIVLRSVARIDTSSLEAGYSALGRHGYHPRAVVQVLVYAMLVGITHSTKISRALETDAAFRLLSGGHSISSPTFRRFVLRHRQFLLDSFAATVREGWTLGTIDLKDLAIDSLRIRANASTAAVRTVERSTRRIAELEKMDPALLSPGEREKRETKLAKHREGLRLCKERGRSNIVVTNESAALMRFPNGASAPGHRVTVTGSGLSVRMAVNVLIDHDTNDFGKLPEAVADLKTMLKSAGVPPEAEMQIAADAGYWSETDLLFAQEQRAKGIDILVNDPQKTSAKRGKAARPSRYFPRSLFVIQEDGTAICPAGLKMNGPYRHGKGDGVKWKGGAACSRCELQPKCTPSTKRSHNGRALTASSLKGELAKEAMRKRLAEPGATARYNRRIGTIEPIFSEVTDARGFRRVSARKLESIEAQIYLALLAHNLMILDRARERISRGEGPNIAVATLEIEF